MQEGGYCMFKMAALMSNESFCNILSASNEMQTGLLKWEHVDESVLAKAD